MWHAAISSPTGAGTHSAALQPTCHTWKLTQTPLCAVTLLMDSSFSRPAATSPASTQTKINRNGQRTPNHRRSGADTDTPARARMLGDAHWAAKHAVINICRRRCGHTLRWCLVSSRYGTPLLSLPGVIIPTAHVFALLDEQLDSDRTASIGGIQCTWRLPSFSRPSLTDAN